MTRSAVNRDSSSVSVNITRPDWPNTHTPPTLIVQNVSPPFLQPGVLTTLKLCSDISGNMRNEYL